METKYTLDYYIDKFNNIPEDKWGTGVYNDDNGHCCAFGHCGAYAGREETDEARSLSTIFRELKKDNDPDLTHINDGDRGAEKYGETPKERVVNYLKSLKS